MKKQNVVLSAVNNFFKSLFSLPSETTKVYYTGSGGNSGSIYNTRGSGGEKYPYGISGSGNTLQYDHYTIRQNVRTAVFDSNIAKAIQDRYSEVVVDVGLKFDPAPNKEILNLTDEQADKWAKYVRTAFDLWCQSKLQHRSQNMSFYQYQRLYAKFQQRDNDMFTRLFYSKRKELLNPLQFETIDPNQIINDTYTNTNYQYSLVDGIEKDSEGVEIAYNIIYTNPSTKETTNIRIPAWSDRNGRMFMLHGFCPEYSGQTRGISLIGHALQEFADAFDFKVSAVRKAISQASLAAAIENDSQDPSAPLEGILTDRGTTPAQTQLSQNPSPGQSNINSQADVNYQVTHEATLDQPGSLIISNLAKGDKVKLLDKAPADNFESFYNTFTAYLSASCNMPHEILLIKFNANYNAARGAIAMFYRIALIWRDEMITDLCIPIFEMWLSEEIAAGRVACPGWQDPILKAAWMSGTWFGAPMVQLDPVKEADANKLNLEIGATTLDRVARDVNGSSGAANRAKLASELKELPDVPWGSGAKNKAFDGNPNNDGGIVNE